MTPAPAPAPAPAAAPAAAEAPPPVASATVFAALLRRDVRVARRELPFFLVRTVLQPRLLLVVFGFLLPRMGFVRGGYTSALVPGILALSLTLASIQAVALPLVQDFGWTKEIEDRLLSPVPTRVVAAEKIVAGVLQGLVAVAFVFPTARLIVGPIPGLTMAHAYLSLGSNVEPERHLRAAIAELGDRFGAIEVSPVYRSAAVG